MLHGETDLSRTAKSQVIGRLVAKTRHADGYDLGVRDIQANGDHLILHSMTQAIVKHLIHHQIKGIDINLNINAHIRILKIKLKAACLWSIKAAFPFFKQTEQGCLDQAQAFWFDLKPGHHRQIVQKTMNTLDLLLGHIQPSTDRRLSINQTADPMQTAGDNGQWSSEFMGEINHELLLLMQGPFLRTKVSDADQQKGRLDQLNTLPPQSLGGRASSIGKLKHTLRLPSQIG